MYAIKYTSSAKKELEKLPSEIQVDIFYEIEELRENPRHRGVEKLTTSKKNNEYKLRVRDYRVKFLIFDEFLIVYVIRIGHRKNIYKY